MNHTINYAYLQKYVCLLKKNLRIYNLEKYEWIERILNKTKNKKNNTFLFLLYLSNVRKFNLNIRFAQLTNKVKFFVVFDNLEALIIKVNNLR